MAAVHGAGSTARAASPASPTGDAALVCSLRGCGAPLKLVGKKRNRDRRPTYTCQRGHARKTCNECGKQVSAAPRSVVGQLCDTVTRRGRNCGIDSTVPHLPCLALRLTTRPVARRAKPRTLVGMCARRAAHLAWRSHGSHVRAHRRGRVSAHGQGPTSTPARRTSLGRSGQQPHSAATLRTAAASASRHAAATSPARH